MKPYQYRDRMVMKNMQFYGKHGVFPEENRLGQQYQVSVTLTLDLSIAGRSDELSATVDYAAVYEVIRVMLEESVYQLIETVAEKTAEAILRFDPRIMEVDVCLTKPNPPFKVFFDGVTVELTRTRADLLNWALIGLGSNVGNRLEWLREALRQLDADADTQVYEVSNVFETAPVGPVEQGPFLNQTALIATRRSADALLKLMQQIEQNCGRERTIHWGPRTLDLDLLLYNQESHVSEPLQVPHPHIASRAFVLVPMHSLFERLADGDPTGSRLLQSQFPQSMINAWRESYRCADVIARDGGGVHFYATGKDVFVRM